MLTKNKWGMAAGFLVTLIIVIASFMVLSGTVYRFLSNTKNKDAEILCHDSVAFRASSSIGVLGADIKTTPFICKTIDQKLKPEGANIDEQKEDIQKQLADKMARCWWMFGEGRYDKSIFNNVPILQNSKCFMCYALVVQEGSKFKLDSNAITPRDFDFFLTATESKKLNSTYRNYIQFSQGKGSGIILNSFDENDNDPGIKPGRAYAVVYRGKAEFCPEDSWICKLNPAVAIVKHELENIPYYKLLAGLIDIDSVMLVELTSKNNQDLRGRCTLLEDTAGR